MLFSCICLWIVLCATTRSGYCSLQIDTTELDVHFEPTETQKIIRISGTMRTKLSADVKTLLQPEINTGYISCAFHERGAHGTRINFAQSRQRLRLNTWIPAGQYKSFCNFSSLVDLTNPRAHFSANKQCNGVFFGTSIGYGSVFPTLDRHQRGVYRLSVSFSSELNIEALSNTRVVRKAKSTADSGPLTHVYFEDTPPLSVDELGLVLGRFQHFETASSGTEGEIDIFSREGHKRTLEIRHGDPVAISVHYLDSQRGSDVDPQSSTGNNNQSSVAEGEEKRQQGGGTDGPRARRHAAELTANLMTSFVDLIHAFWEIQPKVTSKLDVVLLPQAEAGTTASKKKVFFGAPGLIVVSEETICQNKSSDRSCEHIMLKQLSRAALSGYMGCLSRPGQQTVSNVAFNVALETAIAKRMLLRLGVMSEGNFVPLDVEEFQPHLKAADFLDSNPNETKCTFSRSGYLNELEAIKENMALMAAKSAKFGALLRMLEQQIGTVAFNGAVRAYLFRYADCELPAGMDQFRECIAELGSGKRRTHRAFFHHASRFVESFTRQPGMPVLHVRRLYGRAHTTARDREQREGTSRETKTDEVIGQTGGGGEGTDQDDVESIRLEITQRRECHRKESGECPLGNWTIPLTVKIFSQTNAPPSFHRLILNESRSEIVLEDNPRIAAVLIDQSHYGFYRVQYDNLSDFLRFEHPSMSPQPDVALLFDYLHFAEQTGHGLADLPLLVHTVRFQSRPSRTLMDEIANKLVDGPYLRLLAANDDQVETRLRCFYRRFPELDAAVREDSDLARFRSMIAILGGSSEATKFALSFHESCKTLCTREAELSYDERWSQRKLLVESYITALSLRSGVEHTCRQLVQSLNPFPANHSETAAQTRNVSYTHAALETSWPFVSFLWSNAFTTNPQCLSKLLPLAKAIGPTALRPFITSMARGSRASHQLLWAALINHTATVPPRGNIMGHLEGQFGAERWDSADLPLSEIVLSFVKWHSESLERTSRTVEFLREAQQLLDAASNVHPVAFNSTATTSNSSHKESAGLPDTIRQLLERNQRLVLLNRNSFLKLVDSIYCPRGESAADPSLILNAMKLHRKGKGFQPTTVVSMF